MSLPILVSLGRNSSGQTADFSIEKGSNQVKTMLPFRVQRGQGRAVGAAEDHMVGLEVL